MPQPIVVALGDPAGIGPEVVAGAWERRQADGLSPFFAVGDVDSIRRVWPGPVAEVGSVSEAIARFDSALPVWHIEGSGNSGPGKPTVEGAHCALHSLEMGIGLARSGEARALVSAPVSKDQLYRIGFTHPGQTEFIADRCGVSSTNAVMLLAAPGLKVVPITVHVPLRDVPSLLTIDLVVARAQAAARGLMRSYGINAPRLALAGLNPHAGENGSIGREEIDVLLPALEQLRSDGIDVTGPHSPDALFTPRMRDQFDAALCLYHDQALIPLKALYFDLGVNVTLGLPIVRTSPDHGTAFDIAGKGIASSTPMAAAIREAATIASHRAKCGW